MGVLSGTSFETIKVSFEDEICLLQLHRPSARNTINRRLVQECQQAVRVCEQRAKVLVVEGLPDFFCMGADFAELSAGEPSGHSGQSPHGGGHAEALYDLWLSLAMGPFVSIAHVRGKVNAGGVGFVAACDVVVCDSKAVFSLSELLFGLMPACVMPFLIRRVGVARANYLTVMTQPVTAQQALAWHLVDACDERSDNLLRRHLLRLRYLPKRGVARYKNYLRQLDDTLVAARPKAVAANLEVFSDAANLAGIARYARTGLLPWEGE
jgi:polyketide biosynthesis enoyl-CoA hydratase PksH